nr:serine/threonine-protein kinase [Kofleriaceae bacterium]
MTTCSACGSEVLDIDMRCGSCGASLAASGAHKMLGTFVLGQYELVDILGQGGMSVVFKGRHKLTAQEVALKILPPELAAHAQVKGRFLEEAKALAALDHPNIVHLYNFGQENGCFVLAMQYVHGHTWERLILEHKRLDPIASAKIAIDVLRALEYAHGRGVVHRDMKPSNVLVRDHDQSATVMDFGIAKMTTSTKLTATGQTMGTVRYMSPEQVRGHEVDPRTDLYSLGATLYESLVGETPFDGATHFDIMTKHLSEPPKRPTGLGIPVPIALEDALMRSLAKRADDRFQSARDMRVALEAAVKMADVGLHETQRVSRDDLAAGGSLVATPLVPIAAAGDLPAGSPSRPPASATEVAAAIAPVAPPRRGRGVPVSAIVIFVALVGVGGTAAYLLTRDRGNDAPAAPPPAPLPKPPHDATLAAGHGISDKQLADSYGRAITAVGKVLGDLNLELDKPGVDKIVVVDAHGMCDPSNYSGHLPVDEQCTTAIAVAANDDPSTLLVLDDPTQLDTALEEGLARAVNTFQTFSVKDVRPAGQDAAKQKVQKALQTHLQAFIDKLDQAPNR